MSHISQKSMLSKIFNKTFLPPFYTIYLNGKSHPTLVYPLGPCWFLCQWWTLTSGKFNIFFLSQKKHFRLAKIRFSLCFWKWGKGYDMNIFRYSFIRKHFTNVTLWPRSHIFLIAMCIKQPGCETKESLDLSCSHFRQGSFYTQNVFFLFDREIWGTTYQPYQ